MDRRGYGYSNPADAWFDEKWRHSKSPTENEKAVATADMTCKKQVNYLGVMIEVSSSYERSYITEHAADLESLKSRQKVWIENAEKALEETR
ncbi:hypothetical protein [Streptomyces sp. 8N706]|uniref:hypothetical protein n=1 Tax=Streptomyces sp. 8N706 TaxID=3457416 RepID=UPI003FD66030